MDGASIPAAFMNHFRIHRRKNSARHGAQGEKKRQKQRNKIRQINEKRKLMKQRMQE
jgi:hypothetical protein